MTLLTTSKIHQPKPQQHATIGAKGFQIKARATPTLYRTENQKPNRTKFKAKPKQIKSQTKSNKK